jgi:multiple sugar transport system ATP-binding protein
LEAAKVLQIEDYLQSKPSEISGGQRQRVALGRAMVRKPKVFLMDEPLSNLDAKLREHMRVELVRLHHSLDTTSIYVTHDQTEAMTMASKIILLDDGIIQQDGPPEEFYNQPANLFVATFIGSPTMNLFAGKMKDGVFISNDGDIRITPTPEDAKVLLAYQDKDVTVGIRSERFISGGQLGDTFKAYVEVVEMLGKEKLLYGKLPKGQNITISVPGHFEYRPGETHSFGYDVEAIHYFDSSTTNRIV